MNAPTFEWDRLKATANLSQHGASFREYIAQDSPRPAELVAGRIIASVERLRAFPWQQGLPLGAASKELPSGSRVGAGDQPQEVPLPSLVAGLVASLAGWMIDDLVQPYLGTGVTLVLSLACSTMIFVGARRWLVELRGR